jgi:hypothetical protein
MGTVEKSTGRRYRHALRAIGGSSGQRYREGECRSKQCHVLGRKRRRWTKQNQERLELVKECDVVW